MASAEQTDGEEGSKALAVSLHQRNTKVGVPLPGPPPLQVSTSTL